MKVDYILNGDCLSLIKDLEDKSVDVSFTSPPYNRIRNDTYEHYNDTLKDYYSFLVSITDEMLRVSKKQVIVNIQQNHFNKSDVFKYIGHYSDKIKGIVIWEKTNPQPSTNPRNDGTFSITNAFEYFFVLGDSNKEFRANAKITNVISTSVNSKHVRGHGAIMKKEVCDWFISNFTSENDVVLDPFMGCGTTAVCCLEQNRHYIGYEICEEYCDIIATRLSEVG